MPPCLEPGKITQIPVFRIVLRKKTYGFAVDQACGFAVNQVYGFPIDQAYGFP